MANPIRVVLEQDVENLGQGGDVVRVRPGYARNFLIPRGLAVPATAGNIERVDELKRVAQARRERERTDALELAKRLEGTSVKIVRSVGENNKMYGSVTAKEICDAYAEQGLDFDRRKLEFGEPIKKLGLAEIPVRLYHDVVAVLRVEVIKQV